MAHVATVRTEEEAEHANWPCHWCEHGKIGRNPPKLCFICRKINSGPEYKPTKFKIAKEPR